MTARVDLFEAALNNLPAGIALLGEEGEVMFWNQAAESITGHAGLDLVGRNVPEALKALLATATPSAGWGLDSGQRLARGCMVHTQHKQGYDVPVMVRILVLRDGLGRHIGTVVLFHSAESLEALTHRETGDGTGACQAELGERLEALFDDFLHGGLAFGLLWITVDQAYELRKTHGAGACAAMLEKVEGVLAQGLRPAEEMGRWGDDEFLVISHERTPEMLAAHAQSLAGLARTADFRWWGDRVSLTVSIGAAQADREETLKQLLERAQVAMVSSIHAGGNHMMLAPGRQECSPS